MIIKEEKHWLTDACIISGCLVGAALGLWLREMNGVVMGAVIGVAVGYAVSPTR